MGEIRRVLNSFLQMIEQDRSHSLVVAATNHPAILDSALFRRFDDILHYELPDKAQVVRLLKARLSNSVANGSPVAAPGRLGGGIELRGDHARIQRGAQGCAHP